jgi:2-amino-4-hydroxy-6-hydroxymethyldihydropteridine diphosphokinase
MQAAYIGLGSNLGDRIQNLTDALEYLEDEGVITDEVSSVYETEPQGFTDQPWFLNMAARVKTTVSARDLLKLLQRIEARMGRVREMRWGPRVIDLDILLFGREVISQPDLEVPHPRLTQRAFVLIPLLEIDEDIQLPNGMPLKNYLTETSEKQEVRLFRIPED